jgi:DNA-binding LacI/PurR family transcriptional regulator
LTEKPHNGSGLVSRVTLQSVADRVGVSRMTVSNAFSRPDQLSAALRERILAAAEELGYAGPDPAARSLVRGSTGTIGVLWTDRLRYSLTDEIAAGFLGAVADELAPTGTALTLLTSTDRTDVVPARDVPMDGAIVFACDPESPALSWLERRRLPLVYVDVAAPAGASEVIIDDRGGARAAAAHVLGLGHRSVGLLTVGLPPGSGTLDASVATAVNALRSYVARERLIGWVETLAAAGAALTIASRPNSYEDARPAARGMLVRDPPPTAVLCYSDVMAHDVVRAAGELGLRVPTDLSVVGFDDHPLALRIRPQLTTVRQDVSVKGHEAARILRELIASRRSAANREPGGEIDDGHPGERLRLPVDLVTRDSTGPAS